MLNIGSAVRGAGRNSRLLRSPIDLESSTLESLRCGAEDVYLGENQHR